ncbi:MULTISPECIES: phosphopantetheine-binding protein [Eubacterium]|uniref:Phosphopantetheine attachment site n=1 Tax=Eubacterium uniforme TaxID=39495 RepID=A0A1T4VCL9_9FIRM|nr:MULTISPECIES: phosphopantetheine-binding protein [Eubacterium]MCR5628377.1 acyl carrier protein [Eubacterium sp.]SKA62663.1 Phosphopantetheine attachment site [Eubacterium uniforme]
MEELIKLLSETIEGVDFENEDRLMTDKVISSIDLTEIIAEIEDHYDIEIDMEYMIPENFESAQAMLNMIEELQD